ncbi:HPr kinase/phosphorylase [Parvularcula sp. IMCC14364]|uniref:HPr kinase/phosphorylase n=1 Tax=Parvularcula sp. IMCC14364 TaxID=3067902 RepID=UPI00274159B2|nr:hypothetical protein [Parvularcula sp. IMCC14364]
MASGFELGELVQGTGVAVAVDPDGPLAGVLLRGPSGAGKSDLAARLIERCPWRRSSLIADDLVIIGSTGSSLVMRHSGRLTGKMELRGIGIVGVRFVDQAALRLVADMRDDISRLPEMASERLIASATIETPVAAFNPFEQSACLKVRHALRVFLSRHFESQRQDGCSIQATGQRKL